MARPIFAAMVRIGKIVSAHGLQGGVIMTHVLRKKDWLKPGATLFIALQRESYIPFFVSSVRETTDNEMILQLEETDDNAAARKLVGKEVFAEQALLEESDVDSPLMWIGYELIDKELGALGTIDDVFQTGKQWLAQFEYKGKEVLAPLVEQTLERADAKNKKLYVKLPDGLLDVYL